MTEEICRIFEKEGLTGGRIAVNSTAQAFNILDIAVATGTRFENGVPLLEQARICKTQQELDCLRRAAAIADQGFLHTLPHIRPGMTEGEIHDILVQEMEALGGSGAGALVASGPNAGYPHYSGSSRAVQPGFLRLLRWQSRKNSVRPRGIRPRMCPGRPHLACPKWRLH